jgi:hypothetical protein
MVALVFSIISVLACVFLVYALAQFHRELTRRPGEQIPRLVPDWLPFALRDSTLQGSRYRQRLEFP